MGLLSASSTRTAIQWASVKWKCSPIRVSRSFVIQSIGEITECAGRLECGQPEVPANGQITLTQMGSYQQVNYTCNEGYRLEGEGQRICSGRSWRGQQPICVPVPYQVTEE